MLFTSRCIAMATLFCVISSLSAQKPQLQNFDNYFNHTTCGLSSTMPVESASFPAVRAMSPKSLDSNQVYTVPVNAYLLLDEEGGINETLESLLEIDEQDILALLLLKIKEWNDLMPRLQLELCNFHSVVAAPIRNRGYSPSMNRWMRLNYPELMTEDPNESVQLFLTGGQGQNWGSSPDGVVLNVLQSVFFHEVGHYFGLYHTDSGTFAKASDSCNPHRILLYPDNTFVENCIPGDDSAGVPEEECGDIDRGFCSGDLVPDTPVDVGGMPSQCPSIITRVINDEEHQYSPPWTNILRASGPSVYRSKITQGQKDRMLGVFLGQLPPVGHPEGPNSPFQPNFSVLLANSMDAGGCNDFSDVPSTYLYSWSNVNLVKVFEDEVAAVPVFRGRLRYEAINVLPPLFSEVNTGSSYIFDGRVRRPLFEVNRGGSIQFHFDDFKGGCSEEGLLFEENINLKDIVALFKHLTGEENLESPYLKVAADVNNSGSISVADITSLLRRVLGETEAFEVPDFKMLPALAFVSDEAFAAAFTADPFTASWNFQETEYRYLQDEHYSSYLGNSLEPGGMPNLSSFKHQFPSKYTQHSEAMSFKVVESGNVFQQDEEKNKIGETVDFLVDNQSSFNQARRKVRASISLAPGQQIEALLVKFDREYRPEAGGLRLESIRPAPELPKIFQREDNDAVNIASKNTAGHLFSGKEGVVLYPNMKSRTRDAKLLFEVDLELKSGVTEEDIINFLGDIEFCSGTETLLSLNVLIEGLDPEVVDRSPEEPVCIVYNPVRNGNFTFEIITSQKQSVTLNVCDAFGNCSSRQVKIDGTGTTEKFEENISGLNNGTGYFWITGENFSKTGIAILK